MASVGPTGKPAFAQSNATLPPRRQQPAPSSPSGGPAPSSYGAPGGVVTTSHGMRGARSNVEPTRGGLEAGPRDMPARQGAAGVGDPARDRPARSGGGAVSAGHCTPGIPRYQGNATIPCKPVSSTRYLLRDRLTVHLVAVLPGLAAGKLPPTPYRATGTAAPPLSHSLGRRLHDAPPSAGPGTQVSGLRRSPRSPEAHVPNVVQTVPGALLALTGC